MGERIYVGNLPFKTSDNELKNIFEPYGTVETASVIRYKQSGRSKGYAFVEMPEKAATEAVERLNENEYEQRVLKVKIAKPRANFPKSRDNSSEKDAIRIAID